jgi:hypothetical protein
MRDCAAFGVAGVGALPPVLKIRDFQHSPQDIYGKKKRVRAVSTPRVWITG